MKRILLILSLLGMVIIGVSAQRVTDKLTRGLVAIPQGDKDGQTAQYGLSGTGIFVSWRILPTEYYETTYNLYRNGTKIAEGLTVSNYQDDSGKKTDKYSVAPVVKGVELTELKSEEVTPWNHQYWDIPAQNVKNRNGVDVTTTYSLNDCSVADVDGDGQMEFVVKRIKAGVNDASNKTDFNLHECYKMDGTRLWWIDMGPNLMAGPDEQFDLILYDWDQDGKAEALMRGADNMIIHTASGKEIKIGNMNYYASRDEYTREGAEYLLYMNGETGEPYGWDGSDNWTPEAYPLPRYEKGESDYATVWGTNDTGHRSCKHYFGAPYLDGRNPAIFLGRGCYTRHKFCAMQVNSDHTLTQLWRWNCYDGSSPWFGNGFHNFAIADVDMDGCDEIVFGSMVIDANGYGLATTGYGHGDAQHCGDLDPYRWGLEQFVCLENSTSPGVCYTNATTSDIRYQNGTGGDNGRCMAGNFQGTYPGAVGITFGSDVISLVSDKVVTGMNMANDDYLNMRIYWDGDLLDEFMDSPGTARSPCVYKYGNEVGTNRSYTNGRCWLGSGNLNNSSKNNPCFLGDIIGDWREEIVNPVGNALRINISSYPSPWGVTSLWYDHEYRNGMAWQSVGYNQPPHPSFFLGELEDITKEPPALTLEGREEVSGTISGTGGASGLRHLLVSGYNDQTISVDDGAAPDVLTVNTPVLIEGTGGTEQSDGSVKALTSTKKQPEHSITYFTTTLTGGAFGGDMRLVKQGEGTLVLPNVTEKHTGNTDVWNGTLQFDGTMASSHVWLNRHTTLISNNGKFMGGLKADYNATIYPGGKDQVGMITASDLQLGFGSRIVFDAIDNKFDQLTVGTLSIEAKTEKAWVDYGPKYKTPVIEVNVVGDIVLGTYVIGTVESIDGNVDDLMIEGLPTSVKSSLKHENGELKLLIEPMREPGEVVWNGATGNNTWQQAVSVNFLANGVEDVSAEGDDIVFDDNAATTSVTIKGAVSPKSVSFNNETKAYTLSGDSIVGGGPIIKNGKATVTLNNWNHTGATTVNNGILVVNMLANTSGQDWGSLGNAAQPINLNDGTTLRTNGVMITDQTLNISGEATIDVPANKSVIFNKAIKGTGATLIKSGAGSMETGTLTNTYAKLVVKAGTVTSNYSSNNVDMLPKTVEFQGTTSSPGVLWGANQEGGSGVTNNVNFVVPKGKAGTFYGSFRGTYNGTLTGEGTFNAYTGGVRCYWKGDWSAFTGTVYAGKNNRQNKKSYDPVFSFTNNKGLPNGTLNVREDVSVSNEDPANSSTVYNVPIGKVTGKGTLTGGGTWILGTSNEDFIVPNTLTITSKVTKRGTGKMTITAGKVNGALTVEAGTVAFNTTSFTAGVHGTSATTVKSGGRIVGQGLLQSVALQSGATLIPCASTYDETTPGTIKTGALFNANAGSTLKFLISGSKNSTLTPKFFTMNGTVTVELVDGFVPEAGAEFTLWESTNVPSGTPKFNLPVLPGILDWDTSGLVTETGVAAKTGVLRVVKNDSYATGINGVAGTAAGQRYYNLNGRRVNGSRSGLVISKGQKVYKKK